MPYFTNSQGVIPQTTIDDSPGWILVPNPPTNIPEGQELIWLNWEWIVRDRKPEDRPGFQWNWQHETKSWVEGAWPATSIESANTELANTETSNTFSESLNSVESQEPEAPQQP